MVKGMKVTVLQRYQKSLDKLNNSKTLLSEQDVLDILLARDAISKALSGKVIPYTSVIFKIQELDGKLKLNSEKLIQYINLAEYRNNFPRLPNSWWWDLDIYVQEKARKSHPWNRFDGFIRVVRVIVWTGNLTLLGTLAGLFLNSASGLGGVLAIAFPSILSLLQAQSELTETGKKGFDKVLQVVKIPQHFHEEAKLVSSLLITGFLLSIWLNLPSISNGYKLTGQKLQEQEKLAAAEEKFLQAIKLDADNLDARYKLAKVYEELQDLENAKKQYIVAAKAGFLDAYNDLAYWYIQENKNEKGIDLLKQGLQLLEQKEKNFQQLTDKEKSDLRTEQYSIYKNLGWARFQQQRYDDAIVYLLPAMDIAKNSKYQKYIRNPGAAFCIYSKILSKTNQLPSKVKENWQQCRQLIELRLAGGETISPEEDRWLYEAKQQLN